MTDINSFENHINNLTLTDWSKLFDLLKGIATTEKFGEIKGLEKTAANTMTMPYWEDSRIVASFIETSYALGIVFSFDWAEWAEGRSILQNREQDFNKLDIITLCKLITVIIRADRFNDGYLIMNFENGTLPKIIKAIQNNIQK